MATGKKRILILGASGLIGRSILKLLLKDEEVESVVALVRRTLPITHPKLYQAVTDFERLAEMENNFKVDAVFCTLGTTLKSARTKSGFKRCDYHYVVEAAKLAKNQGVEHFLVVSAIGADPNSTFFYNQIKGEMERDVFNFGPSKLTIMRPSLLVGDREERRPFEEIGLKALLPLKPLMIGPLKKYRPIEAEIVAKEMFEKFKGSDFSRQQKDLVESVTLVKNS